MTEAERKVEQVRVWIKDAHAPQTAAASSLENQIEQQQEIIAEIEQRQLQLRDVSEQQQRHNFAVSSGDCDVSEMLESLEQFRLEAGARLDEMVKAQTIKEKYEKEEEELNSMIDDAREKMKTPTAGTPEQLRQRLAQHSVSTQPTIRIPQAILSFKV